MIDFPPPIRSIFAIAAAATLAVLTGTAAFAQTRNSVTINMDERAIRSTGILTTPLTREQGAGAELSLTGTVVIPQHQIRVVAAPAGGLVEFMYLSADEPVTAGAVIAQLRSPAIIEAQRLFLAALADNDLANDRMRRAKIMFEGRALPERDWQIAQTEVVHAGTRLDERTQMLSLMDMSEADIDALRKTRRMTSTVSVNAPINGTVVTRHVSPGERVEAAAPLYTIAELEPLWLNLQVPASRIGSIRTGATVTIPAYGVKGTIIRIGRTVDQATQSAIAVAAIATNNGAVRPGLAVTASVQFDSNGEGLWSVPTATVVRHRDRTWVFVKSPSGFVARPVQILYESARGSFIRGEFAPDEQIASRGILSLLALLAEADRD